MENAKDLWHCPVCHTPHSLPLIICSECGANLLLLVKIRLESDKLARHNKKDEAKVFYKKRKKERLY